MNLRKTIFDCARKCREDTVMRWAFLRAIGVDSPMPVKPGSIIQVDESREIRECFKNQRRVNL